MKNYPSIFYLRPINSLKMKYLSFLIVLLCSCGNEPAVPRKKTKNPVTIQFFETYSINEIRDPWMDARKWTSQTDPVKQTELIGFKGLQRFIFDNYNNTIGFVKKEHCAAVDSILNLPEVISLFPKDLKFAWGRNLETSTVGSFKGYCLYALKIPKNGKAPVDSHDILESVPAANETTGMIDVHVEMTETGSRKLQHLTTDNLNRFIAITLHGKVIAYPRVLQTITDQLKISQNFTMEEAGYLSDQINAGR